MNCVVIKCSVMFSDNVQGLQGDQAAGAARHVRGGVAAPDVDCGVT